MAISEHLLIYGGFNEMAIFNDLHIFSTTEKCWAKIHTHGTMPPHLEKSKAGLFENNSIILFGGYSCTIDNGVEYQSNDTYSLNLLTREWNYVEIEGRPSQRFAHSLDIIESKVYVFGGTQANVRLIPSYSAKCSTTSSPSTSLKPP